MILNAGEGMEVAFGESGDEEIDEPEEEGED